MSKIKVVGTSTTYDFDEVEDAVIFLGGKYYFKHDEENLIKVKTPSGYRLYRKDSPLICKTVNGTHAKKSDCIKTSDDLYFEKIHPDTIKLDNGEYTHKKWCIMVGNKYYLKTDPLVNTKTVGFALKSKCITMCEERYGANIYDMFDPERHIKVGKEIYYKDDTREVIHWDKTRNEVVSEFVPRNKISGRMISGVFKAFKDGSNPQVGRYDTAHADEKDVTPAAMGDLYVLRGQAEWFNAKINELQTSEISRVAEAARKKCNASFGDLDDTENIAIHLVEVRSRRPDSQFNCRATTI